MKVRPVRSRVSMVAALALTLLPATVRPQPQRPTTPERTAAEAARRAAVVARVDGAAITVGEFEDMLNEAPAPIRQTYLDPARRRENLENLVQTMLLAGEARRRGLDHDPQVRDAIRRILGQRVEQVEVLEAITPQTVSDAEVAAYYNAHVADYQQPEYRRATVIITADRERAAQAVAELRRSRGDMRRVRELVRQYSADEETRAHDGDAYYVQRTGAPSGLAPGAGAAGTDARGVPAPLAAALFALPQEMDVTPQPAALPDGRFGVAVLTGMRPAMRRTLDDPGVVASIRGFIVRERRTQREAELLGDLRARLHPEVHEELLQEIHLPPTDLGNLPPFDPHTAPTH